MSEKASKIYSAGDSALHDVSISPAPAEIDSEGHVAGTGQPVTYVAGGKLEADDGSSNPHSRVHYEEAAETRPGTWYGRAWKVLKTPGSALQIVIAAVIALAIGMAVNVTVDTVPSAAVVVLGIPGRLWLRSLTAVGTSHFHVQSLSCVFKDLTPQFSHSSSPP